MDRIGLALSAAEEEFQITHAPLHGGVRRGYEYRVARPGSTDPVLRPSEMSRVLLAPASPRQQHPVDFPDEPVRQRKTALEPTASVFQRRYVVRGLDDVVEGSPRGFLDFEEEEVGQGRLRTFYPGGEHRLLPDVDIHEVCVVRQQGRHAVQATQTDRGLLQRRTERSIEHERGAGRQRRGHESPHRFTAGHGEFTPRRKAGQTNDWRACEVAPCPSVATWAFPQSRYFLWAISLDRYCILAMNSE